MTNEKYMHCLPECPFYDQHIFSSCSYEKKAEPEFVPEGNKCKYNLTEKIIKNKSENKGLSVADISFLLTAL